jgi:dsDNA-binding SOS-regulon protein
LVKLNRELEDSINCDAGSALDADKAKLAKTKILLEKFLPCKGSNVADWLLIPLGDMVDYFSRIILDGILPKISDAEKLYVDVSEEKTLCEYAESMKDRCIGSGCKVGEDAATEKDQIAEFGAQVRFVYELANLADGCKTMIDALKAKIEAAHADPDVQQRVRTEQMQKSIADQYEKLSSMRDELPAHITKVAQDAGEEIKKLEVLQARRSACLGDRLQSVKDIRAALDSLCLPAAVEQVDVRDRDYASLSNIECENARLLFEFERLKKQIDAHDRVVGDTQTLTRTLTKIAHDKDEAKKKREKDIKFVALERDENEIKVKSSNINPNRTDPW